MENTLLLIIAIKVKTGNTSEIKKFFEKNHHDILSTFWSPYQIHEEISEIRDIMLYSTYYIAKYITVMMSEKSWKMTNDDMYILIKLLEYKCPQKIELTISNQNDPWKLFRIIENSKISCDFTIELEEGISWLSAVENRMKKTQNFVEYLIKSFNKSR